MDLLVPIIVVFHLLAGITCAGHALLFKRDPRAAWGWISVCLIFPVAGPFVYFLFGINRVQTRARKLEQQSPFRLSFTYEPSAEDEAQVEPGDIQIPPEFAEIAHLSETVTRRPLLGGNAIQALHNGENAFPAMIEAIESARNYLYLTTYLFDADSTGKRFIDALGRAVARGVDVRVMIDGIGEMCSRPRAGEVLKKNGVQVARFLPPKLLPPTLHINLRNHRKILVADGRIGFVGGMNIGDRHLADNQDNPQRVVDLHFRLQGPVVSQIEKVFLEDWRFVTGQEIPPSPSEKVAAGDAICRAIIDGPNEDLDKLALILVGAIAAARKRIFIVTPYFIPSREMIAALQAAALRGLEVAVVLPSQNNLPFVQWASTNMLWEILQRGVRVYLQPPPFVHTKLFIVDDHYVHIGSANIDPRSLRLNFELAIEIYHNPTAEQLSAHVRRQIQASKEVSLKQVDGRRLLVRLRDSLAWLFAPYL